MYGATKLVDLGIDWLTITTPDQQRGADWREAFKTVATEEQIRGHKWVDSRLFGYSGETCGHVFWGKGQHGHMVRLSSAIAESRGALFEPDGAHTTRIDIQATVEFKALVPNLIERMYEEGKEKKVSNGRPPVFTLIKNSVGARTLYVGKRASGLFGRIYDKGIEQALGEPGKFIRFELECKDWAAPQAVASIYPSSSPDAVMLSLLGNFFTARNVPVPWSYVRPEADFRAPRITVDDAASLTWVKGPVANVVARLMETVGPAATLQALLGKWREGNTDDDIIGQLAMLCADYVGSRS